MSTRSRLAVLALAAVTVAALAALAGCGTKDDDGKPAPAPAPATDGTSPATGPASSVRTPTTPFSATAPGLSAEHPAPIGTSVEPAKDWTVAVTEANVNADAAMAQVNQFNKPQLGHRYVLVNMRIVNQTGKPAAPTTALKLSALVAGTAVMTDFTPAPAPKLDLNAQLQPGAAGQGWVPFQVSAGDDPVLLLAEPLITVTPGKDQRFLSLQ